MAEYLVVGLGIFGRALALEIQALGNEVIGVDRDMAIVQEMSGQIREAIQADATSEATLAELGVSEVDAAVVATGNVEDAIMITLLLKRLGVKYVIAKASSELQGEILRRVGADRVVFPEHETAVRLAHGIAVPEIVDYLSITSDMGIAKLEVPHHLVGLSYAESQMDQRFDIYLVAIVRRERVIFGAPLREKFEANDVLIVAGKDAQLRAFSHFVASTGS
jgi:trk system potassium uptake protein TrkA